LAGRTASLAACQKDAIAPTRVSIAVHLVCELARCIQAAQARKHPGQPRAAFGGVSPDNVFIAYDGSVELLDAARTQPAYVAPEQVSGGDVDRRADVFSLGIVLWELLTATNLFARPTASETRIAVVDDPIHDVRDVNPEVPAIVADVLGTALSRDRDARFDSVEAFSKALSGACSSSGIAEATKQEVGQWVTERVPQSSKTGAPASGPVSARGGAAPASAPVSPPVSAPVAAAVPDLDIPGSSRTHRSQPNMAAAKVPPPRPAGEPASVPAFDVSAMAAAALAPSTRGSVPPAPAPSGRASAPGGAAPSLGRASSASVPSHGGGKSIDFTANDDDDFDMEIERNVAGVSAPMATSSRTSGAHAAARKSGGGLELAQPSRMAREGAAARARVPVEPGIGLKLGGALVTLAVAGGTAFALFRQLHRAGGHDATRLLPHAFDGTSATESGAVSLVCLVLAVIVGFVGFRMKPHAWAIVASGGAMLLLALAMVTVTLASTGESPTPPDGVLLVPYLVPAALVLLALGLYARSSRVFARSYGARRVGSIPLAAIAGAIAFVAFEISRLAR
jgi:hypothetical protein